MYCEVPRLWRCCCCVPLRYGVLVFGYLNLIFCALILGLMSFLSYKMNPSDIVMPVHGALLSSHVAVPMTLYCIDLIFNLILIVGSHKKNTTLLRIFYYYGLVSTIGTFVIFCVTLSEHFVDLLGGFISYFFALAFTGLVLQGYLVILVRSEFLKLEDNQQLRFVNHAAEIIAANGPAPLNTEFSNII